jgi:hypothetical protein
LDKWLLCLTFGSAAWHNQSWEIHAKMPAMKNLGIFVFSLLLSVSLSAQPVISVSADTLYPVINGCDDSVTVALTIENLGSQDLSWYLYSQQILTDDFDDGIDSEMWSSTSAVSATDACGYVSPSYSLRFDGAGTRQATTHPILVQGNLIVSFQLKFATGSGGCENADAGEDLVLEYSLNGGASWIVFKTYDTEEYTSFSLITEDLSSAVNWNAVSLRWRQVSHSGSGYDHLAIDDVSIYTSSAGIVSASQDSGVLLPTQQSVIQLTFHSAGIPTGLLPLFLVISSNDTLNPDYVVYCELQVNGSPDIVVPLTSFNFGLLMESLTEHRNLQVLNPGCDSLLVSGISTNIPGLSISGTPLMIPPFDSAFLLLTYTATNTGAITGNADLVNNDANVPLQIQGTVFPVPGLIPNPDPLQTLIPGCNDSMAMTIGIDNTYPDTLNVHFWSQEIQNTAHLRILALTYGADMSREYPNTLSAIRQFYTDFTLTELNTILADELRAALIHQDVLLIPEPESATASNFTALGPVMQEFADRGGRVVFCGTTNAAILNNSLLFTGTYSSSTYTALTVTQPQHPMMESVPLTFTGPTYIYSYNFTNPDLVQLMTTPGGTAVAIRRQGNGLVAYAGFDFYNVNANAARVIVNLITKPLFNYGRLSSSFLSIPPGGFSSTQVKLEATGLVNGVYNNHIYLSAPSISWYDTLLLDFTLDGDASIRLSGQSIVFDTTIVGASTSKDVLIYNDGCDSLHITDILSSATQFIASPRVLSIPPFDSSLVTLTFSPDQLGVANAQLLVQNSDINQAIMVTGTGIPFPVMHIDPDTIEVLFSQCNDTVYQNVWLHNTGQGILQFAFNSQNDTVFQETSDKFFTATGQTIIHTFQNLPSSVDSLFLGCTINGDYDGGTEYLDVYIEGILLGRMDGGATNVDISMTFVLSGTQLTQVLADGIVEVSMVNSSSVNTGYGTNLNRASLTLLGGINVFPSTGIVQPQDSAALTLTLISGTSTNGTHKRIRVLNSNDPYDPLDSLCVLMTINNPPQLSISPGTINFGGVIRDAVDSRTLYINNSGSESYYVHFDGLEPPFRTSTDSVLIFQCMNDSIQLDFFPDTLGFFIDTLNITSAGGNYQVVLTGTGLGRPEIEVLPLSFQMIVNDTNEALDTLTIFNVGEDTLHCTLSDEDTKSLKILQSIVLDSTSGQTGKGDRWDEYYQFLLQDASKKADAAWLMLQPAVLSIPPGGSAVVVLRLLGKVMGAGFSNAEIRISSNDPMQPLVIVDLSAEHTLSNFTTYDNNNNLLQDIPDNDMDVYLFRSSPLMPIEFNIFTNDTAFTNGNLSLYVYDIDETQGEVDEVYLNGHLIGTLTGANGQWSTTVLSFPASFLNPGPNGKNLVQVYVDVTNAGWATTIDWGQIVTDNTPTGQAFIRYATPNKLRYLAGENPQVTTEADALSGTMSVKVETNLLDSNLTNVDGISRTLSITGTNDESFTENLSFPSGSYFGKYFIQVILYDAVTYIQQDIRLIEIERGLPDMSLALQGGEGCTGDTLILPVSASGIQDVTRFMLSLNFDTTVRCVGIANPHASLASGVLSLDTTGGGASVQWQSNTSFSLTNGLLFNLVYVLNKGKTNVSLQFGQPRNTYFMHSSGYLLHISDSSVHDTVFVIPSVVITQHPLSQSVLAGGLAVFTITATNATEYIWQESLDQGVSYHPISDTNMLLLGSTLWLPSAQPIHNGRWFRCIVKDTCGDSLVSQTAILNVIQTTGATLRVYLQGAWIPGKGSMRTQLRNLPGFPLSQPYNVAPWNYAGSEAIQAVAPEIVDWVLVELRSATDRWVERKAGLLLSDGRIVSTDLINGIVFDTTGSFYIAVLHRNHLPVMSAAPVNVQASTYYDFTNAGLYPAYGGANLAQAEVETGVFAMYVGDILQDGNLRYSGPGNDRASIFQRIGAVTGSSVITATATGYYREDLNLDGVVKYSGPSNDPSQIITAIIKATGSSVVTTIFNTPTPAATPQ